MKICVFPSDPISAYYKKGEIKPRYYNPNNMFSEVVALTFADQDVSEDKVQIMAGKANFKIRALGNFSFINIPRNIYRAYKIVKQEKPDVIRAFSPTKAGFVAAIAGKLTGVPVVVSIHNEHDEQRKYDTSLRLKFSRLFEFIALSLCDVTICVTGYLQAYARRYGSKKIEVIYNKIYSSQFTKKTNFSGRNVLWVGRLDGQKCPEIVINAMRYVDGHLTVIGRGSKEKELRELAQSPGINGKVTFVSSVPNAEISKYYLQSNVYAIATYYEGFCIPVLEAMACGVPVVACDTMPLPEVLGNTGMVVKNNAASFAIAINKILNDVTYAKKVSQAEINRAKELDGTVFETKEADLYLALLSNIDKK